MKTAAIYARVSSALQDIENSIQAQVKACQKYSQKENLEIYDIYSDRAESGRTSERPEFQRMIKDAKDKKFQVILIHKLDRFARNREDAVTYKALLRKYGIELFSITEKLGDDIYSRLIEGILEVIAEFYSLNLGEEVKKGQKEILNRGFWPAGRIPYGYKLKKIQANNEEHARLEIDEKTAPVIKKIFEMAGSGYFSGDILKYLISSGIPSARKTWNTSSLFKIISNRMYLGENRGVENHHPAIVTEKEFITAQVKKKENQGNKKGNGIFPLSGISSCSLCGSKLCGNRKKYKDGYYRYYYCTGYHQRRVCSCRRVKAELIEGKVFNIVLRLIGRFLIEEKSHGGKTTKETKERRIQAIQKEINIIQGQRENIINAIAAGIPIEEVKDKLQELSREKEKLLQDKERVKEQVNNLNNLKIHKGFTEIKEILPKLNLKELKELYKNLIRVEFNILEKTGKLTLLLEPPHEPIVKRFSL